MRVEHFPRPAARCRPRDSSSPAAAAPPMPRSRWRGSAATRALPARSAAWTTTSATASSPTLRAKASIARGVDARRRRQRVGVAHLARRRRRKDASRRGAAIGLDERAAARCRRAGRAGSTLCWSTTAFPEFVTAGLRGGHGARHPARARPRLGRRQPDDPAAGARHARDLFSGGAARHHRHRRSRRGAGAARRAQQRLPRRHRRAERRFIWLDGDALRHMPAFKVEAIDTLGAGDVFHAAFTLALAEGRDVATAHALRQRRRRRSNARASAAPPARRSAPRSRRSWRARQVALVSKP